jgi:succinyl-diaminopimelate desuccinylase
VVPVGNRDDWTHDPFAATVEGNYLVGRGAADMKSSIAAMLVAVEEFLIQHPDHSGRIAFLITSDEEGPALFGTRKVIEHLQSSGEKIDWCLVGEPSSDKTLGDVVKNGRRGSLSGFMTVRGVQGHVAYPDKAQNPIHQLAPALLELVNREWDKGNEFFPATSFQVSNIQSGTGASNVIPGEAKISFNLRFSTEWTAEKLQREVEQVLSHHNLDYRIRWEVSHPFLTPGGPLVTAVSESLQSVTGLSPRLLTNGGTSDGRFIAPTGAEVVELGPVNATIHKVDECVLVEDIERLKDVYRGILDSLLLR